MYEAEIKYIMRHFRPCRVVDMYEFLDWYVLHTDIWWKEYGYMGKELFYKTVQYMWEHNIIDINFDKYGHPWMVYSNWVIACPYIKSKR